MRGVGFRPVLVTGLDSHHRCHHHCLDRLLRLIFPQTIRQAGRGEVRRGEPQPPLLPTATYLLFHKPPLCRLDEVGYGVGLRLLEVLCYRERGQRRETRLLDMLKFVHRCVFYACVCVVVKPLAVGR